MAAQESLGQLFHQNRLQVQAGKRVDTLCLRSILNALCCDRNKFGLGFLMASVVTFGQFPEEEPGFLAFVQKTGEIWARATKDDPLSPKYEPGPVAEFLRRYACEIVEYATVSIYLGLREDVLSPEINVHEVIEGGTQVPFIQNGSGVEGVFSIVGGSKVNRSFINSMGSRLLRYDRGEFRSHDELALSNLCFYPGTYKGRSWVAHPASFMKWGKKILDWARRHTPEMVPVHQCNYEMRATTKVADACKRGLKLY